MSQRETNLLWMRDLIEHLSECQQQLMWTSDPATVAVLTETISRDLERCQRICEQLRRKVHAVAAG